jgi:hypothetical protein
VSEDEARLHKHLDEQPSDAASRRVLADLLEEQGQVEAARCQRWLADKGKYPDSRLDTFHQTGWHWWSCPDLPRREREHASLPPEVQAHMQRGEWLFKTRAEAEDALAKALARLPS